MSVVVKRVYEAASADDGARILVDRLWPRGIRKEDAAFHAWLKEIAPSNELRKWYHAHPEQWAEFRRKYLAELATDTAQSGLQQLFDLQRKHRRLTLLYASKNTDQNNAVVLKELVEGERKPPTGTGPVREAATRRARAARRR